MKLMHGICSALVVAGFVSATPAAAQGNSGYFKLQTMFQEPENKCFEGNRFASDAVLQGASFMDGCQEVSGQYWKAVPEGNGFFRLKTQFQGENKCLEGNRYAPDAVLGGGAFMDDCRNVSGQLWQAVPDQNGYFRLKTMFQGDNKCLEGNRFAPESVLQGAAFMDDCQNVSGQLWKVVGGSLVNGIPQVASTQAPPAPSPSMPGPAQPVEQCRFYEHVNYEGREWVLQANDRVHWYDEAQQRQYFRSSGRSGFSGREFFDNNSGANDNVSSVRTSGSCRAVLWEDPFENGRMLEVAGDEPNFVPLNFNDVASEAECICQSSAGLQPAPTPVMPQPVKMPTAVTIQNQLSGLPGFQVQPQDRVSLGEFVLRPDLRRAAPSIEIQSINFDSASAVIKFDQYDKVQQIGQALSYLLNTNNGARFLIEGHTDAVGSDSSNYVLSQNRAEALRSALVNSFGIPAGALVTAGFGERDLLVPTQQSEWQNRRVTLRRIDQFVR